jgi:hypothetical protein
VPLVRRLDVVLLVCCFTGVLALALLRDIGVLFQRPTPLGLDGYYYLVQVKSLKDTGRLLFHSSTPLFFFLMDFVQRFCADPVVATKIACLVLESVLYVGLFVVLLKLSQSPVVATSSIVVAMLSPSHTYLLVEFNKELLSLALLAIAGATAVCLRRTLLSIAVVALLVICACLSHKSALIIVLLVIVVRILIKISLRSHSVLPLVVLASWAGAAALRGLYLANGMELAGVWLPWERNIDWWPPERLALIVLAAFVLGVDSSPYISEKLVTWLKVTALLALCVSANPLLSFDADFLSGRALLTANLQLAILVSVVIARFAHYFLAHENSVISVLALALVVIECCSPASSAGTNLEYLNERDALVQAMQRRQTLFQNSMIIAPHKFEFAATFATGAPVQQLWKPTPLPKVFWILRDVPIHVFPDAINAYTEGETKMIVIDQIDLDRDWERIVRRDKVSIIRTNAALVPAGYTAE